MNNIYVYWHNENEMTDNRKICLKNLRDNTECKIILITDSNLNEYILNEYPLHEAYQYLSYVHKSDYLRSYFMNFYGGGYSDIKETRGSWKQYFTDLSNSDKLICGYPELRGQAARSAYDEQHRLGREQPADQVLIGCGNFICKPHSIITEEWYSNVIKFLDEKLEALKKNPAEKDPYNPGKKYPIGWNHLMGTIFHKVCYMHSDKLLRTLHRCVCSNYR